MRLYDDTMGGLWLQLINQLYHYGKVVHPRPGGSAGSTQEIVAVTLHLTDAHNNIFVNDIRKLSYRFMIAEWLWIMFGHDDVATISQYNSHIADFSDDGKTFNGSYGVPVKQQWPYILGVLKRDIDSRQAILQIYRQPTGMTKDVPCTLSLQFLVRDKKLHTIATMRSSDVWLGLPYDSHCFTQMGNILAGQLGVELGHFTIHLGSSHMYDRNADSIDRILVTPRVENIRSPRLPGFPPGELELVLTTREMNSDYEPLPSPWVDYARVLTAKNNEEALKALPK